MFIFRDRAVSIMVLSAVALHFIWATILMVDQDALGATALSALHRHIPMPWLMWVIATAALMALLALVVRAPLFLLMLLPQQILLMMSAAGAVEAIWLGQFADGVVRSRGFLAADQCYSIIVAIGHTAAIIVHARRVTL